MQEEKKKYIDDFLNIYKNDLYSFEDVKKVFLTMQNIVLTVVIILEEELHLHALLSFNTFIGINYLAEKKKCIVLNVKVIIAHIFKQSSKVLQKQVILLI